MLDVAVSEAGFRIGEDHHKSNLADHHNRPNEQSIMDAAVALVRNAG